MGLIDLILNLVGFLLWLSWRSARYDPLGTASPATLAATLRRAEPRRLRGWPSLAALGVLLLIRAVLYQQVGTAANWTPKMDLGLVVLAFRNDLFRSVLLFSLLSFFRLLVVLYLWALILSILNRRMPESDPAQRLLRVQLGCLKRWPWPVQALLPGALIIVLWVAVHPLLLQLGLTIRVSSRAHLVTQGALIAVSAYCTLKYLLPLILLIHFVVSYIYLGRNPLWEFFTNTARNLLAPIRWLPLRVGKLDLAPLLGVILILAMLHILPGYLLPRIPWPQ